MDAEAAVLVARRMTKRAKRIRRAVRQIGELSEAAKAAGQVPGGAATVARSEFVEFDPARFRLVLAEEQPPTAAGRVEASAGSPRLGAAGN